MQKLTIIKTAHTFIWLFFNVVLFYIAYAVFFNRINTLVWVAVSLVLMEGLVLLAFRGSCPLTIMARRHSNSTKANFDIFLPEWLAKHNKTIYTSIFVVLIILILYRLI